MCLVMASPAVLVDVHTGVAVAFGGLAEFFKSRRDRREPLGRASSHSFLALRCACAGAHRLALPSRLGLNSVHSGLECVTFFICCLLFFSLLSVTILQLLMNSLEVSKLLG